MVSSKVPNRQEIFEISAVHLLTQRKRSRGPQGCLYRGPKGLKCAAGPFIPDSVYHQDMEHQLFSVVVQKFPKLKKYINTEEMALYLDLQYIHDYFGLDKWKSELQKLGEKYELDTTFLKKYRSIR